MRQLFSVDIDTYIVSIVSIEARKKIILATDSGLGRQQAFHYEDMNDVSIIMDRLFSVDMNTNIVSNVYVREKTG